MLAEHGGVGLFLVLLSPCWSLLLREREGSTWCDMKLTFPLLGTPESSNFKISKASDSIRKLIGPNLK